jgi:hypothetical protein
LSDDHFTLSTNFIKEALGEIFQSKFVGRLLLVSVEAVHIPEWFTG